MCMQSFTVHASTPHTHSPTSRPTRQPPPPRPALKALKALTLQRHRRSSRALQKALTSPDPLTRWAAISALRKRRKAAWLPLFRKATKDKDKRVVYIAIITLGELKDSNTLKALAKRQTTLAPWRRDALCRAFLHTKHALLTTQIRRCLQDPIAYIRIQTAQTLLSFTPNPFPLPLRQEALLVLRNKPPLQERGLYTPKLARKVLERASKELKKTLAFSLRLHNQLRRDGKSWAVRCMKPLRKKIAVQRVLFQHYKKLYETQQQTLHVFTSQQTYARAMLSIRRISKHKDAIVRCVKTHTGKAEYTQLFEEAIWLLGFPLHLYHPQRDHVRFSAHMMYDNFVDAFREDLYPKIYYSREQALIGPRWDLLGGGAIDLSYNTRWGRRGLFAISNHLGGNYFLLRNALSGLEEDLQVFLSWAEQTHRHTRQHFLQARFRISQSPPYEEQDYNHMIGSRASLSLRAGSGWRWGYDQKQVHWWQGAWSFKAELRSLIEWPLGDNWPQDWWSPWMKHEARLWLEKKLYVLTLGLEARASYHRALGATTQVPAWHFQPRLTWRIGHPKDGLFYEAYVGLAFVRSAEDGYHTLDDTILGQSNTIQGVGQIKLSGPIKAPFLYWSLAYTRTVGPSIRPGMSYHMEDRLDGLFRIGSPPFLDAILRKRLQIDIGVTLRSNTFPSKHLTTLDTLSIGLIRFFGNVKLPITPSLRVVIAANLELVSNGFHPYRILESAAPEEAGSSDLHLRSAFMLMFEYWLGG